MIKKGIAKVLFTSIIMMIAVMLVACGGKENTTEKEKSTFSSIVLDTTNAKTEYIYGEDFSTEGLKITAKYSDGSTENVALADAKISTPNMDIPGTRNVTVTYLGKTERYQITIVEYFPAISEESLIDITGVNEEVAYRVETEDFNLEISETKSASTEGFIKEANSESVTSGDKFLTNFGVKGNYFGFTFTSDQIYENAIIVLRMSYDGETSLDLDSSMRAYLNYKDAEETNEVSLEGKQVNPNDVEDGINWQDVVLRGITIPEGTNTLTFRITGEDVPNLDYIDFYIGKRYISSFVEVTDGTNVTKEFEDFDTEKIVNRQDMIDAHGLQPGQVFIEPATTNIDGTSKGTSAGGFTTGTEISTTIRTAKDVTLKIYISAASVSDYRITDEWEFYIDGILLDKVEDTNIKDGDPGAMEYWQWKEVSLGEYDLTAGDHFFTAKIVGSHCNVDIFRFEVVEGTEQPIE